MSFLALAAVELGSLIIGRLLRPKSPQRPGDKFSVPDIIEGTPVPYVFGTAKIDRPFLAWWGNVDSVLDTNQQTLPTQYYAAMVFNLCQGPIDNLIDVAIGGKSLAIWPTSALSQGAPRAQVIPPITSPPVIAPQLGSGFGTDMVAFNVVAEDLFGGLNKDGGVVGQIRVYPGSGSQLYEPLLLGAGAALGEAVMPANPPDGSHASGQPYICVAAFDGILGTTWPGGLKPGAPRFNSFWWGNNSPTPRTVSFIVTRYPKQLQPRVVIGNATAADANPVNVIWELLTDPVVGAGLDPALFDKPSFVNAAVQVINDQLGVSGTIDTPTKLYDLIVDLLRHIDGVIFPDPVTGLYTMKLARPDYDPTTLEVLDESRMQGLVVSRFSWPETLNQLWVTYRRYTNGGAGGTPYAGETLALHYHANIILGGTLQFGAYYTVAHPGISPTITVTVHNTTQGTSAVAGTDPHGLAVLVDAATGLLFVEVDFANEGDVLTVDYTSTGSEVGFVEASNPIQNLANRQATGEPRGETVDFRYFTNDVSAFNRGRILLQALSSTLDKLEWTEDRRGNVRRPGDVVIVNVPEKGLNNTVVRITEVDYGLLQQGKIKCQGLEDVWGALLEADFGTPRSVPAVPTNPAPRQAPGVNIGFVACSIRVGLFPSDTSFNIELQRDTDGTGAHIVGLSPAGGFAGTTTFYDDTQTIGTTWFYRARLIRPGYLPGPWTAWMAMTGVSGSCTAAVCTLPTVAESPSATSTVGTLALTVTDPQARISLLEFRHQSGNGIWSAWAAATAPYSDSVTLAAPLDSQIQYRVTFTDCSGNAAAQSQGSHTFSGGGGGGGSLATLSDANITSPANLDLLQYQTSDNKWHNVATIDAAKIGSGTLAVARGGTNIGTYATGDVLYASGSGTIAKLGIGGTNQVLVVSGTGIPAWATLSAGTPGSLPYWVAQDPHTRPLAPGSKDDYFDDSTNMSGPGNGLASIWTARGSTPQTRNFEIGRLVITCPAAASSTANMTYIDQPVPAGSPWEFETEVITQFVQYDFCGIVVTSNTGKLWLLCIIGSTGDVGVNRYSAYNNRTSFNTFTTPKSGQQTLRVKYDGTNLIGRYCLGFHASATMFQVQATENMATAFATGETPSTIGVAVDCFATSAEAGSFAYFRQTV